MGKHSQDQFVVRVPHGVKERLSEVAQRQGITRNDLVVRSLERTLGMQHEDDELPGHHPECRHPKASEEKVLTHDKKGVMLVRCGECGVRLR